MLIVQEKPVRLKEWMVDRNSSLQIKLLHTISKNGQLQVVFWKKDFVFFLCFKYFLLKVAGPEIYITRKKIKGKLSTPKEVLRK